jgi:hypothetical protein
MRDLSMATGGAQGRRTMRIEVPTARGFDFYDPRLELRRAATEAQRGWNADETSDDTDRAALDAEWLNEPRELEAIGAGSRDGRDGR